MHAWAARGCGAVGVPDGARARTPQPAARRPRLAGGGEKPVRVAAPVAVVEPDGRRAAPHELEVDVPPADPDVPEEPAIAIDGVERRVCLQPRRRADGSETGELAGGRARVTLAASDFRCVDLDEPDAVAARRRQRVAVDDSRDGGDERGEEKPHASIVLDQARSFKTWPGGIHARA